MASMALHTEKQILAIPTHTHTNGYDFCGRRNPQQRQEQCKQDVSGTYTRFPRQGEASR